MALINNVLELSQLKADRVDANGSYQVNLGQPIIVNAGDQINLRLASLDTQRIAADTIIIPQDLPVSITFSTYDLDYDRTDKVVLDRSAVWAGDGSGNPSFEYYATYTDEATLYEFQSIDVDILNFVPPSFDTDKQRAGSILFPYHQTIDAGRFGFVVNLQYVDANGDVQTFQVSGGNNYQWQPGYFGKNSAFDPTGGLPGTAGSGPESIPYPQFTAVSPGQRGSANEGVQWATGFSDPNPSGSGLTGAGSSAQPPTTSGSGIDGDVPRWVDGGSKLTCTQDQYNPNNQPPAQRVVFKAGTLKVLGVEGSWPGSETEVTGYVNYSNPDDSEDTPKVGVVKISPGASVPNGPENIKTNVPVQLNQFNINTLLVEQGGGVSATPVGVAGLNLDIKTATATIQAGSYDPASLAITLTQLFNDTNTVNAGDPKLAFEQPPAGNNQQYIPINPFLQRTDDENVKAVFHHLVDNSHGLVTFTNENTYEYFTAVFPPPIEVQRLPYYIGATQFALEYGSAGDVFSLEYAHMPLLNPDEDSGQREMVGLFWTGTVAGNDLRYYQVNQSSGIAIHDMQPVSFWQDQLGIRDRLVVPLYTDVNGTKYYQKNDLLPRITFGYASLDQFMLTAQSGEGGTQGAHTKGVPPRKMDPIPPSVSAGKPDVVYIDVTGETRAIIARTITAPLAGGYFIIECMGLGYRRGGFIDDRESNPKVAAIVSANYLQGNILTGFGDAGIPYTHVGNPYVISNVSVRVLDSTGQVAADLGPNNAVFIDIISQDAIMLAAKQMQIQQQMQQQLPSTRRADDRR